MGTQRWPWICVRKQQRPEYRTDKSMAAADILFSDPTSMEMAWYRAQADINMALRPSPNARLAPSETMQQRELPQWVSQSIALPLAHHHTASQRGMGGSFAERSGITALA